MPRVVVRGLKLFCRKKWFDCHASVLTVNVEQSMKATHQEFGGTSEEGGGGGGGEGRGSVLPSSHKKAKSPSCLSPSFLKLFCYYFPKSPKVSPQLCKNI